MTYRMTTTLAICLAAGLAFGIALARPGSTSTAPADPLAAGAAGSNDAPGSPAVGASSVSSRFDHIEITDFSFTDVVVPPGANVVVRNLDEAPHTVTARGGSFSTGTIDAGGVSNLIAPTEPGTYEFFCEIHPSMTGTLTVVGGDGEGAQPRDDTDGVGDATTAGDAVGGHHDAAVPATAARAEPDDHGEHANPSYSDAEPADPAAADAERADSEPAGDGAADEVAPPEPEPDPVATLAISEFSFESITVAPGTQVVVENRDGAPHTVTAGTADSPTGEFDTRQIGGGESATFVAPTEPGTYEFYCQIHPSMTGTITVTS